MKVPPKRKGNHSYADAASDTVALNESPSEKEGKSVRQRKRDESFGIPSMKVPPKRKGNPGRVESADR